MIRYSPVIISLPPLLVLFSIIAYFVYGNSLSAALAVFLLGTLWGIAALSCVIPFAGIVIYYFLMMWIFDWVSDLTGLTWSWVIDIMFWLDIIFGAVICLGVSLIALGGIGIPRRVCTVDSTGRKICRWVWR